MLPGTMLLNSCMTSLSRFIDTNTATFSEQFMHHIDINRMLYTLSYQNKNRSIIFDGYQTIKEYLHYSDHRHHRHQCSSSQERNP